MKKIVRILFAAPIFILASCGGSDGDLSGYGVNAKVGVEGVEIRETNLITNVEQKILPGKIIEIKKGDVEVKMSETDKAIDFASVKRGVEMWPERTKVVLEEPDAMIVENLKGVFKGFEVHYTKEGQGGIFKFDVEAGKGMRTTETLEQAKTGLEIARSVKFTE